MPKPQPNHTSEKEKAPPKKLPASIVNAAPTTLKILQAVTAATKLFKQLEKEMNTAKKGGSIPLARAFVALHRLNARVNEELEPLNTLFKKYKELEVPQTFEA